MNIVTSKQLELRLPRRDMLEAGNRARACENAVAKLTERAEIVGFGKVKKRLIARVVTHNPAGNYCFSGRYPPCWRERHDRRNWVREDINLNDLALSFEKMMTQAEKVGRECTGFYVGIFVEGEK